MGQVLSASWTPTPTPCCVGFPFVINIFPFTITATTIIGNHTNTEPIFICLSIKMPLNCSSLVTQRPFIRTTRRLLTPHHGKFHTFSFLFNCQHITRNTQYKNKTPHSVSLSKFDTNYSVSSSIMEEQQQGNLSLDKSLEAKYSKELDVAVRAVQMACFLCQKVQENLISKSSNQVHSKDDNSPVTVADWSVQAIVSWLLSESFGSKNVSIVAEEDVQSLSTAEAAGLLEAVVKTVNNCLVEAPRFGFQGPVIPLRTSEVLEAISRCNSNGGPEGRFWALDPVDGTLGFVRGDQYAIALALIENGEPVVGVLGCPNYPMRKEWLSYHHRYHRIISKLTPLTSESWDKGCVMYARRGSGGAWIQPLILGNKKLVLLNSARPVKVSSIENPALATFCEPVEKSNSSHSFTAGLAHSVGLRKQPLRVYSMVKYAAIARGDAEIFMKFARCGYKEKIWDHAAGVVIIEEAGGVVTDAGGHPLDFSRGIYVEGLDRGIIACAGAKLHEKIISAVDASWDSSSL